MGRSLATLLIGSCRQFLDHVERALGGVYYDGQGGPRNSVRGVSTYRTDRKDVRCASIDPEANEAHHSPSALKAISYWNPPDGVRLRVDVTLCLISEYSVTPKFASIVILPKAGARDVICGLDRAAHYLLRNDEPVEGTELADHLDRAAAKFEEGMSSR